jgi:hypothetical protein
LRGDKAAAAAALHSAASFPTYFAFARERRPGNGNHYEATVIDEFRSNPQSLLV